MKRTLALSLVGWLSVTLSLAQERKRVAVLDFDYGTVQNWWEGTWDIGKGVADIIVTKLVEDGTFRVFERARLDSILAEQDFTNSDRANPSSAAKIGRVIGVNAMIMGSITQFGAEQKKKSFGGLVGAVGGLGGARIGTSKGKAKVAIDARLVDINTGEILAVAKGEGESSRSGLLLGGIGAGRGGFGAGQIDMGSSDFRQTILGEAVDAAVSDLAEKLIATEPRLPEIQFKIDGLVADVDGATVILNVGSLAGLKVGSSLQVLRVTRVVKDPATGDVIREVTRTLGELRVDEVDDRSAVGTVVSGQGIRVGDKVSN